MEQVVVGYYLTGVDGTDVHAVVAAVPPGEKVPITPMLLSSSFDFKPFCKSSRKFCLSDSYI